MSGRGLRNSDRYVTRRGRWFGYGEPRGDQLAAERAQSQLDDVDDQSKKDVGIGGNALRIRPISELDPDARVVVATNREFGVDGPAPIGDARRAAPRAPGAGLVSRAQHLETIEVGLLAGARQEGPDVCLVRGAVEP